MQTSRQTRKLDTKQFDLRDLRDATNVRPLVSEESGSDCNCCSLFWVFIASFENRVFMVAWTMGPWLQLQSFLTGLDGKDDSKTKKKKTEVSGIIRSQNAVMLSSLEVHSDL